MAQTRHGSEIPILGIWSMAQKLFETLVAQQKKFLGHPKNQGSNTSTIDSWAMAQHIKEGLLSLSHEIKKRG